MAELRDPYYGSVINVPDSLVERYTEAGWLVGGEASESGRPKGNASREEWAAYADSVGAQYAEDAKREGIKAAVDAVGDK